jgi:hypothetical protein
VSLRRQAHAAIKDQAPPDPKYFDAAKNRPARHPNERSIRRFADPTALHNVPSRNDRTGHSRRFGETRGTSACPAIAPYA